MIKITKVLELINNELLLCNLIELIKYFTMTLANLKK